MAEQPAAGAPDAPRAIATLPVPDHLSCAEYAKIVADLAHATGEAEIYLWAMVGDEREVQPEDFVIFFQVTALILANRRYAQAILNFIWIGTEWDTVPAAANIVSDRRAACREVMAQRSCEHATPELKGAFDAALRQLGIGP